MSQLPPQESIQARIKFVNDKLRELNCEDTQDAVSSLQKASYYYMQSKAYANKRKMENNVNPLRDILGLSGVVIAGAVLGGLFGCALGGLLGGPAGGAVGLAVGIAIGALLTNTLALGWIMFEEKCATNIAASNLRLGNITTYKALENTEDRKAFVNLLSDEEIKDLFKKLNKPQGFCVLSDGQKTLVGALSDKRKTALFLSLENIDKARFFSSLEKLDSYLKLLTKDQIKACYVVLTCYHVRDINGDADQQVKFLKSLDDSGKKSLYLSLTYYEDKHHFLYLLSLDNALKKFLEKLDYKEIKDLFENPRNLQNTPALEAELKKRKAKHISSARKLQ